MFVIMPKNSADWQHAMFMLSYYNVECSLYSNGEDAESTYMVVSAGVDEYRDEEALRLAEMCFQVNWHQSNEKLCLHCVDHADRFDSCGHLTFTHPINPAF